MATQRARVADLFGSALLRRAAAIVAVGTVLAGALPTAAGAEEKLVVAKAAQDFALIMADYGKKAGIYKKNGLDIDVANVTQARMVQAVIAGSIDISLASGTTLAFAAKGAPLKAVAALSGPPSILVLIVRPDNSVTSIDQLKGRIAAVTNFGSLTDWAISQIAVHKGWELADIKRVAVGDTPARVAALKTRNVDAAVIDIAAALDLEERGEAKILLNFGDLITDFQNQLIFASDKVIAEKPDAVRAFVKSWFDTLDLVKRKKAETVAFAQEAIGVRASVAGKVYDLLVPSKFFSTNGVIEPRTLDVMGKSFVELKLLPKEQDLSQFVTDKFLPGRK